MRSFGCLVAALLLGGTGVQAQTCAVSTTPLAFGSYGSPQGPRVDSSASVQVRCTPAYLLLACDVSYSLSLSSGQSSSGSSRQLSAGTGLLRYDLYSDAARTVAWGDGGAAGAAVSGRISTGLLGLLCLQGSRTHSVYGRIPAFQNVPAGLYQDQVILTIAY